MAATTQQYGNKGYGQIGSYGNNPYDQRDDGHGGDRFNNYSQGRYDDRMCSPIYACATFLT